MFPSIIPLTMLSSEMVSAIATLLLAYGLGSSLGPLLAPLLMKVVGPNGLCIYLLLMCRVLFIYTFCKIRTQVLMLYKAHVDFVSLPRTTPNATPIDTLPQMSHQCRRRNRGNNFFTCHKISTYFMIEGKR